MSHAEKFLTVVMVIVACTMLSGTPAFSAEPDLAGMKQKAESLRSERRYSQALKVYEAILSATRETYGEHNVKVAEASFAAADMIAQAEHDAMASAVLLTPDTDFAGKVKTELTKQLKILPKRGIARSALESFGAVIVTSNIDEAIDIANRFAPEHLELMVKNPRRLLSRIKNAGAVFLGHYTPEALGDYVAGPNHILPTNGTARFSSPLGVYDFIKRMSVLSFSEKVLNRYGRQTASFAEMEGLDGHSKSIKVRMAGKHK